MIEPLGIVTGADARAAVEAGLACWLAGGPSAFMLVRDGGRVVPATSLVAERLTPLTRPVANWAGLGPGPHVMGILNATPDSFSDGGRHLDPGRAIDAGLAMVAAGAALLDVGGESTRPGATPVSPEEEQARVLPVIAALARAGVVISVDTRHAATMARALDAGARIVNDVSALTHDPAAAGVVAARGCPVILMHMRGTPVTMGSLASYADVVGEVFAELALRRDAASGAGVAPGAIALDPGYGFAKAPGDSVELLRRQAALVGLGHPLVVGVSRKGMIGRLGGEADAARRGPGSVAAALHAIERGASVVRVHDVAETVQGVRVWWGVRSVSG